MSICGAVKMFVKTSSALSYLKEINALKLRKRTWITQLFLRKFAKHYQIKKQVYFFHNTEKHCLSFEDLFQTVDDIRQFGIRSVHGGFRRRPELIKQRLPDLASLSINDGSETCGLFEKSERIQQELTEKVLQLISTKGKTEPGCCLLDIGCGRGWSLTIPAFKGFCVTGIDLDLRALSALQFKIKSKYLPTDFVQIVRADITRGLCFRQNTFDMAISISFLQWLCVGKHAGDTLDRFFRSLSFVLKPKGKAGIQFYPRNSGDVDKAISHAQNYFKGALVSDFPHFDRGRKLFLILINDK